MNYQKVRKFSFLLSLIIFSLSFILISYYSWSWDLTNNKKNTISQETIKIIGDLNDNLIINYYISAPIKKKSLFPLEVSHFLQLYSSYSPKIIYREYEEKDIPSPLSELGLLPQRTTIQEEGSESILTFYSGIEILYAGKRAVIPFIDKIDDLEYSLTSILEKALYPIQGSIGIVLQEEVDTVEEGFKNLFNVLSGYNIQEITLSQKIDPIEFPILIVIGASKLNNVKIGILKNYLSRGGAILFSSGGTNLDVLQEGGAIISLEYFPAMEWLKEMGIYINPNIVLDPLGAVPFNLGSQIITYPAFISISGKGINDNNSIMDGLSLIIAPWVSSIFVDKKENIDYHVLMASSDRSILWDKGINVDPLYTVKWLEESLKNKAIQESRRAFPLGISLEITYKEKENSFSKKESRMIVLPSRYFFHDAILPLGGQNLDLLIRSIDWLLKKDYLISLKKEKAIILWNFETKEKRKEAHTLALWVNAIFIPLLILGFGSLYIFLRKSKSEKSKK